MLTAADELVARRLPERANARLREIVAFPPLPPWEEVVRGELRHAVGGLERLASRIGPDRPRERELRRLLGEPGAPDRARAILGARYLRAMRYEEDPFLASIHMMPAPSWCEDLLLHAQDVLRVTEAERSSADPLERALLRTEPELWDHFHRIYLYYAGHLRRTLLASHVVDGPPANTQESYDALFDRVKIPDPPHPHSYGGVRVWRKRAFWNVYADAGPGVDPIRIRCR